MSLSENLQFLRAREGVTQEQLAERLDGGPPPASPSPNGRAEPAFRKWIPY